LTRLLICIQVHGHLRSSFQFKRAGDQPVYWPIPRGDRHLDAVPVCRAPGSKPLRAPTLDHVKSTQSQCCKICCKTANNPGRAWGNQGHGPLALELAGPRWRMLGHASSLCTVFKAVARPASLARLARPATHQQKTVGQTVPETVASPASRVEGSFESQLSARMSNSD
jgi:hypothetical protein